MRVETSLERCYVHVWDVDGKALLEIPVPFGLVDLGGAQAVLRFGVLMIERHHPDVEIVQTKPGVPTSHVQVVARQGT